MNPLRVNKICIFLSNLLEMVRILLFFFNLRKKFLFFNQSVIGSVGSGVSRNDVGDRGNPTCSSWLVFWFWGSYIESFSEMAGARGNGVAQRCVGCEHAVVAMAMTPPWRRDQGGEPIEELAHREVEVRGAIGAGF